MSIIDDFNVLELSTNATEQEAKAAYRRLARRYHPDKNPNLDTTEHFQRIHDAYQNVLQAIKRSNGQSWQPYSFTEHVTPSPNSESGFEFKSDAKQRAYVKEQQRAYQDMKRSNAEQERAKEEALNKARNTLHERRMKALYEEMRKADSQIAREQPTEFTQASSDNFDHAHHFQYDTGETGPSNAQQNTEDHPATRPYRLYAAKAAFVACSYLTVFAAGIYSANYFDTVSNSAKPSISYISGLYPQFRQGTGYTLEQTRLFTEPSITSTIKTSIPKMTDVTVVTIESDWLTLSYNNTTGWAKAENLGFGSALHAKQTGCIGQPGLAPRHGTLIGNVQGSSRLRILNQLSTPSLLVFQSLDGQPPFSIYLQAGQPLAANSIPRGSYRLVLESGSLYHSACHKFLFNEQSRVLLDKVDFASTEQSLTLRNLVNP
ncbi:molecular chaperone DnaJ [Marinomonas piezotolerans]|uniref:Molecular chaperone DnaJ n=1 Tax=Marinomonas piezotolerans TaxID=2213058 RepID=A0A370UE47_9GAMM|nr:DnaJ domain-containing protein [Marinomonas piezotolerans]RDL46062.1 molecular chaperone DnaJ [Marinomonas piezotolerans]